MQKSNIFILLGLVALIGAILLLAKNKSNPIVTQPTEIVVQPTIVTAEASLKTIEIEAGSFYYKPNQISLKKGEKVKIVMNSVSMMHDFVIDELNVKLPITKSGDTGTVEFTADKVGTFEYYCSVGQHRKMGQVGKLIVTE